MIDLDFRMIVRLISVVHLQKVNSILRIINDSMVDLPFHSNLSIESGISHRQTIKVNSRGMYSNTLSGGFLMLLSALFGDAYIS